MKLVIQRNHYYTEGGRSDNTGVPRIKRNYNGKEKGGGVVRILENGSKF